MILYIPVTDLEGHPLPFEHNNVKEWGGGHTTLYICTQKIYKLKWANFKFGTTNNPVILQIYMSSGLHPFEIPECTCHCAFSMDAISNLNIHSNNKTYKTNT